jgi:hypothetical protein
MNSNKDLSGDVDKDKVTPIETLGEDTKISEPALIQEMSEFGEGNSAGMVVLQWLTYAFWGWMIVGVAYLVSVTATYMLNPGQIGDSTQEPVAYGIAAVLVLLPVALLCDIFYSKHEVEHKKGASSVVMVIHAVLFALLGIGTLITIAFSLVNMSLSGYHTGPQIVLITACIMFVLYFLTLVRTVRPFIAKKLRFIFKIVMVVVVLGICAWGIVGPVAAAARTKDDRAVSAGLTTLSSAINGYASNKGKLPENLNLVMQERGGYGSADWNTIQNLVDRGMITYKANIKAPNVNKENSTSGDTFAPSPSSKSFYYELCGTFKYDSENNYKRAIYSPDIENGYDTYLEPSVYHAGKNCHNLMTTGYSIY